MSFALLLFGLSIEVLFPFPPALRGRVRVGGIPREVFGRGTPTPDPSPQGGGARIGAF
jgi:hypothetical protein